MALASDSNWGNQQGNPQGIAGNSSRNPDSSFPVREKSRKQVLTLLSRSLSTSSQLDAYSSLESSPTPRSRPPQTGRAISIGQWLCGETSLRDAYAAEPELRPHVGKPWLEEWLAVNTKRSLPSTSSAPFGEALIEHAHLARHAFLVGKSGYGKSRLAVKLAIEQLKAGCSLVAIDPKDQSILHLLDAIREAGFPANQVTLGMPTYGSPPAWNPLDVRSLGISADMAAKAFVDVIKETTNGEGWGSRMADILRNAAMLAAAHALSLFEVVELLRDEAYREALLSKPPIPDLMDEDTYAELMTYFKKEFPALTKGGNLEAILPVLNKVREPLRSPFLRGMFLSQREPFDLSSLWRTPQALLINLDMDRLGEEGTQLLGGMLVRQVFSTALRAGGKGGCPVVLLLDEIAIVQRFLGRGVGDALAMARSYDLRVIAACQHLAKLNPELRADLTAIPSIKVFFRPGDGDVSEIAKVAALEAPAAPPKIKLVVAERDKRTREPLMEIAKYPVVDSLGGQISLTPEAWTILKETTPNQQPEALARLMAVSKVAGPPRVKFQNTSIALEEVPVGLPDDAWGFGGPSPMWLLIRFPRPKIESKEDSATERERQWEQKLRNLPVGHAVMISPAHSWPGEVGVDHVSDPSHNEQYLQTVLRRGQNKAEISASLASRRANVTTAIADDAATQAVQEEASDVPKPARSSSRSSARKKAETTTATSPHSEWGEDNSI